MALQFTKATKQKAKLRAAVFGPSGAGKTYSMLRIATGIGGTIGVIDTERGSASKYADRFDFVALNLPTFGIDTYVEAIKAAASAGVDVLIIDSLTHGWQELIEEVEKIAKAKYRGNTWSAWSEGTPKQRRLIEALLQYPGHILASMRSRTEWSEEKDERTGKMRPVRIGLSPQQGKGIEYEFDLLLELSAEHVGTIIKDRSGRFQDRLIEKPDEDFGAELLSWLSDGVDAPTPPPEPKPVATPLRAKILAAIDERKASLTDDALATIYAEKIGDKLLDECTDDELRGYSLALKSAIDANQAAA